MTDIAASASEKVAALLASLQEDRENGQTSVGIDWVIARLEEIAPKSATVSSIAAAVPGTSIYFAGETSRERDFDPDQRGD